MIEVKIQADNPGLVFACYGLFELIGMFDKIVLGAFQEKGMDWFFRLNTNYTLTDCVQTLKNAEIKKIQEKDYFGNRWVALGKGFKWDSWAPVQMSFKLGGENPRSLILNWWRTPLFDDKTGLKLWGGRVRVSEHLQNMKEKLKKIPGNSLEERIQSKTSLGFDARICWTPIDVGYSLDETEIGVGVSPLVELLSAIGLQGFRPKVEGNTIYYSLWMEELPLAIARTVCAWAFPKGRFGSHFSRHPISSLTVWKTEAKERGTQGAYKSLYYASKVP